MYRSYSSASVAVTDGFNESVTSWPSVHWAICALLGVDEVLDAFIGGMWEPCDTSKAGSLKIPTDGACFDEDGAW